MHDEVDRRPHLLADGARREFHAGHQHHGFQTRQRVSRTICVDGGQAAIVPRVHGLEHVERFGAANLADDDAIGSHAECIDDQFASGDAASPFDVRRSGLHPHDMFLIEDQFRGVFDRDDPFVGGNHFGHRPQERRLTGASAARHKHILASSHDQFQEPHDFLGKHTETQQFLAAQSLSPKAPYRQRGTVERDWRKRGVHTAAVGKSSIDHGGRFVDATTDASGDPLNDPHQVIVVAKANLGLFQPAETFDVHLIEPIHQNVGDGRVEHQGRKRSDAERLLQ